MKTFQDFLHIMDFIGNQTVQDVKVHVIPILQRRLDPNHYFSETKLITEQHKMSTSTSPLVLSQGGGGQRSQAVFIPLQESTT